MNEQKLLDEACKVLSLEPIKIAKVDRFRWILEDRPNLGPEMIRLERALQRVTRHPIDLRVAPKKDKNRRFDRNYLRGVEKL